MTLYREQIVDVVVSTLIAASTAAGSSIYADRDWPLTEPMLPAIRVKAPFDRKDSLVRGVPQFTSVAHVVLRISACGATSQAVVTLLSNICDQVEQALLSAGSPVQQLVQQFVAVETEMRTTSISDKPAGEVDMRIECEYYQEYGPFSALGTQITTIGMEISQPSGAPVIRAGIDGQTGGVPTTQP